MSRGAAMGVRPNRLGLGLLGTFVLAVSLMLVLVSPTHGRSHQHDNDDSQDHDDNYEAPEAAAAASRSIGANNKTYLKHEANWVFYFFRNPDPQFKAPLDGYLTGYGLELERDVLLINMNVVARAIKTDPETNLTHVMAARRIARRPLVDPTGDQWTIQDGVSRGTLTFKDAIGGTWGIYKANFTQTNSTLRETPDENAPRGRKYPSLNNDQSLASNCYAYALSAPDWKAANEYATNYGLPAYPDEYVNALPKFTENTTRHWSRWPVKRDECWENRGTLCRFSFDSDRWHEEHMNGKYNSRHARSCGTFQDVGAPIMCGPNPWLHEGYDVKGVTYEREYLRLSYVIEAPEDVDPVKPNVTDTSCKYVYVARMLAPHYDLLQKAKDDFRTRVNIVGVWPRPWGPQTIKEH